jgi:putative inorganic carbon (HCO3(-)) transporter
MKLLPMNQDTGTGVLMRREEGSRVGALREGAGNELTEKYQLAFLATVLFSILLYLRPHEVYPGIFGAIPLAKLVAAVAIGTYFLSKIQHRESMSIWPIEFKMILFLFFLAVLFIPFAANPGMSIETLNDPFLKVVVIFFLMINLVNSRKRLRLLISGVVLCGIPLGLHAIKSYLSGEFALKGLRITGMGKGLFGNPNDLAICLNMLLPLAVVLGMTSRGIRRWIFLGGALVMFGGIIFTYSRGGFLGIIFSFLFMLWKLSRRKRLRTMALVFVSLAVLLPVLPGSYSKRILTIFESESDTTGSSHARQELLMHGINQTMKRPIIGVGIGNFTIYSLHGMVAHNSYVEIAAELGIFGLLAYLILILAPFRSLGRLEKEVKERASARDLNLHKPRSGILRIGGGDASQQDAGDQEAKDAREFYYLIVGVRATLIAYIVVSFFGSVQYLWYLYYPVAYAISLGVIHTLEVSAESVEPAGNRILMQNGHDRGGLWNTGLKRGVYWLKSASGR